MEKNSDELKNLRFEASILRQQLLLCSNPSNYAVSQFVDGIQRRDEKIEILERQTVNLHTTISQSRDTIQALCLERKKAKEDSSARMFELETRIALLLEKHNETERKVRKLTYRANVWKAAFILKKNEFLHERQRLDGIQRTNLEEAESSRKLNQTMDERAKYTKKLEEKLKETALRLRSSEARVVESQSRIDSLNQTIAVIVDESQQKIQNQCQSSSSNTSRVHELEEIIAEKDRELERVTSLCKKKLKEERMKRLVAQSGSYQENVPLL